MLSLLAIYGVLLIGFSASTYLYSDNIIPRSIDIFIWDGVPFAMSVVFVIMFFLGMGQSTFFPLVNAVLVEKAEDNMRGRVLGVLSLDRAMTTFGGAAAGFLAAAVGSQQAQIIFGIGLILTAGLMYIVYPPLRKID